MKRFKCPICKTESRELLEVTYNVIEYGKVYITEKPDLENENVVGCEDIQNDYDSSKVKYECTNCGYELLVEGKVELEKYLEAQE